MLKNLISKNTKNKALNQTKDTWGIIQNTFKLFWDDKDLFKPVIRLSLFEVVHATTLLISTLIAVYANAYGTAIGIVIVWIILGLYKYYYITFQKSVLSHGAYQVIQGKDATYKGSKEEVKKSSGSIILLSILDYVVTRFINSKKNNKKQGLLTKIILKAAEEVWDLLENYVVPVIVIDNVGIRRIPSKLKELKNNVPGALVGVFGIDVTTKAFGSVIGQVGIGIWLLSGVLAYVLGGVSSNTVLVSGVDIAYVPLIIAVYLTMLLSAAIRIINESLKATYYTTMYVAIQHPDRITASKRQDLTNYLTLDKDVRPEEMPFEHTQQEEALTNAEKKLAVYLAKVGKPTNKETLKEKAVAKGYSEEQFEKAWRNK